MHIRLVEGGRLKECRDASKAGVQRRSAARGWRFGSVAREQKAGWHGAPMSSQEQDPLLRQVDDHAELRETRRVVREQRQTADTTQGQAGSSQSHGAMMNRPEVERQQQAPLRPQAPPDREAGKGKKVMLTPKVFKPGDHVMYGAINTGWTEVVVTAVDLTSIAAGEEIAYTILIGESERSTVASKLREIIHTTDAGHTPRVFQSGEHVMYGTINTGWTEVTVTAVDLTSVAAGKETAYTIHIGDTERSTVASRLREIIQTEDTGHSVAPSAVDEGTTGNATTNYRGRGRQRHVTNPSTLEEAIEIVSSESGNESRGEDDWIMDESGEGGGHLSDALELDPELRGGDLIFQRYESKSGCSLTGWHKAGRGIVPWSEPGVEWRDEREVPTQTSEDQSRDEAQADPPHIHGTFTFDRTRQVRSVPWRLSGAAVRLVDCTKPKLGGREGVVEGWEQEAGQVRVRVAGESVLVWTSEVVQIAAAVREADGGRKRRTMSGPSSMLCDREEGVKRARYAAEAAGTARASPAVAARRLWVGRPNLRATEEVTSSAKRNTSKKSMRGMALVGMAEDVRAVMRGVWKWAIRRSQQGISQGGEGGRIVMV